MSAFSQFKCVLIFGAQQDPAIDEEKMFPRTKDGVLPEDSQGFKYIQTRDERHVVLHEGRLPVWFVMKPIKARALNAMVADLSAPTPDEHWMIVQNCLQNIENCGDFALEVGDFKTIGTSEEKKLTESAMERFVDHFGLLAVRELGASVLRRTTVPRRDIAPFLSQAG